MRGAYLSKAHRETVRLIPLIPSPSSDSPANGIDTDSVGSGTPSPRVARGRALPIGHPTVTIFIRRPGYH